MNPNNLTAPLSKTMYSYLLHYFLFSCFSSLSKQEAVLRDATGGVKHCHDNSHAQEDREREKKVARKRLYVVAVICLIFMIGEILGESLFHFLSLAFILFFHNLITHLSLINRYIN